LKESNIRKDTYEFVKMEELFSPSRNQVKPKKTALVRVKAIARIAALEPNLADPATGTTVTPV
jgi:hypothetical protein